MKPLLTPIRTWWVHLAVAIFLLPSIANAERLLKDSHRILTDISMNALWTTARGLDGMPLTPAHESDRDTVPLARSNVVSVVWRGELSGLARWCGLDPKRNFLRVMQGARSFGLNEVQLAFTSTLHGASVGAVESMLNGRTCSDSYRNSLKRSLTRNQGVEINFRASSPSAYWRVRRQIPQYLTGVWMSDDSSPNGDGSNAVSQMLFLDVDGIGALVTTGLPQRLAATFDRQTNTLNLKLTHNGKVTSTRQMRYDPDQQALKSGDGPANLLFRDIDSLSTHIRSGLGLEPTRRSALAYLPTEYAMRAFFQTYWHYDNHKAFATSPDGAYAYSAEGLTTGERAAESALSICERYRKKTDGYRPCVVVNIDGNWQANGDLAKR